VARTYEEITEDAVVGEMARDRGVLCIGYRVPARVFAEFGEKRVLRTPIAEPSMVGMAVGAAASGMRPIVNLTNVTFSFLAFDQIANQVAKMRFMFGAQTNLPLVLRAQYFNGSHAAAQHSQTGYALFAHLGGIKIVLPSNPVDAGGLLITAIRDDNPVYFFEPGRVAGLPADSDEPLEPVPFGRARVWRHGSDVTIVALGYMVTVALAAAERLAADGISAEVIDPRTLVPLDLDTICESVRRTGRLIVVDESLPTCSMASEIASSVIEAGDTFGHLRAAPRRVCTAAIPVPFSPPLEDFVLPNEADVHLAASALMTN
jgi:acetoin:2,6-dichlorophenolindophenol oxidoreductase subunit beta